jgi:ParB-like chromosome segregation protein Spo0J
MPDSKAEKIIRVKFNTKMFNPSDLIIFDKNNKDHPEDQIIQLMKSIEKYGVVAPLIIDSNKVIIA